MAERELSDTHVKQLALKAVLGTLAHDYPEVVLLGRKHYLHSRADSGAKSVIATISQRERSFSRCRLEGVHGLYLDNYHRLHRGCDRKADYAGGNEPSGFILTTILGVVGAFLATFLGQALGWYRPGEGAGLIGAIVGAVIVLFIWSAVSSRRGSSSR